MQVDGSHHRWLGNGGPRIALLLTVDDATGTVPAAMFSEEEDTPSYFLLMNKLIQQCGIPLAIYSDRHPVFKFTGDTSRYPAGPTQFARAMEELGTRQIFAGSPQAKGRVERAAGTFQDRLVSELRLAGSATIAEANEVLDNFIPRFNERFGVQAEQDCPAYRCLEQSVSLDRILCFKHRRKVSRDNTVKYKRRTLQLLPGITRPTYAGVQVEVQKDLDGQLLMQYQGQTIPSQEAPPRPTQLRENAAALPESSGLARGIDGAGDRWDSHLATLETGEATSESHRSPEGSLGEGSAGQAQRPIPQGDGSRTRRLQKHRPQVRLGRKSTTQEEEKSNRNATGSEGCIYLKWTFSLIIDSRSALNRR